MKKNKILAIAIAAAVALSSIVPAFAVETTAQNSTKIEAKQANQAENLEKLTKRAAKLGVDITGLSNKDARAKIQVAEAEKLGIDITGLSKEEAKVKIKSAFEAKDLTKLTERATKL
ncbi:MAG TPA: hypothetical protein VF839_07195, partial [Clostridium sp.]